MESNNSDSGTGHIHLTDLSQGSRGRFSGCTPPVPESPMAAVSTDDTELSDYLLPQPAPLVLPSSLTTRLYTSHFLSTWNSRLFEFGAVIFLAEIFPSSLLPLSVYALVRSTAVILGAQVVGDLVDRAARSTVSRRRLEVVRASIVGGRTAVVGSCAVLLLLQKLKSEHEVGGETGTGAWGGSAPILGLFVVLIVLACIEKVCATMNLVSVERDWVVVMTAGSDVARQCKWRPSWKLHTMERLCVTQQPTNMFVIALNARMRRIDLLCKLLGPLAIASVDVASTTIALWATLGMNLVSILPEYICIAQVSHYFTTIAGARKTKSHAKSRRSMTMSQLCIGAPNRLIAKTTTRK